MNLVEAKKLSDVVIDSTRFSEVASGSVQLLGASGASFTITGTGKVRLNIYLGNSCTVSDCIVYRVVPFNRFRKAVAA